MQPIRCFLVEPSGRAKLSLRRYANFHLPAEDRACSVHPYGYHNAEVQVGEIPVIWSPDGYLENLPTPRHDDPRWPQTCPCGYVFTETDEWQINQEEIYVPAEGNEGIEPFAWPHRDLPAGAMYFPTWLQNKHGENATPGYTEPTDGKVLAVMVPKNPDGTGSTQWIVDAYCSNCDRKGQRHHCWCRHGQAPWITVNKTPPTCDSFGTCGAGAGSIWTNMPHGWHGFLQNGYLVNA